MGYYLIHSKLILRRNNELNAQPLGILSLFKQLTADEEGHTEREAMAV